MTTGQEPGVGPGAEDALTPRTEAPEGVLVHVDVDDADAALAMVENHERERRGQVKMI